MNARVTWLEGLRAMDVVAACLSQPFSGGAVYYGEAGESVSARCMLALIKRCKIRVDLFPVSLSLAKESPEGQTLVYNVSEDMFLCGEKLFKGSMGDRPLRIKNAISCLMSAWLRNRIAFAAIAGSKAKTMRNKNHVIRFERNSMNKMLCRLYEERGFVVKETWGIYEYIRNAKTILSLAKHVVKSKVIPARPRSNIANIRPSVWIEYDKISMIDFTFWKKHTNNALFDIVNYLDRGDTPVTGKITGEIENNGELWVDAHSEAIASNITIPALAALIKGLLRPDDRPFWIKMFDFEYNYWTSAYAAYFKKFKVKILIQHQDTSWKQEAQAAAVESAGGIMMGFHWSNYPLRMTPSHLFPYHVFFEWGKIFDNFLPLEDNLCNYWFPCGMWIYKNEADLGGVTKSLKNLEFTFAIFDSSAGNNTHQTLPSLSRFYSLLLGLLEKNASWGAVVKSKSGDIDSLSILPDGKDLVRRFRSLTETGRVHFLNSRLSPVTAVALTDISVCYGMNSAGIVAGVHGYKALHWDCVGWTKHPFYNDPGQKFIFKTLEDLEDAIMRASKGDSSIGDFSKWKQPFNHFDDFNADRRVGEFIQDIMDMSLKTVNAREMLDFAAKRYIERNEIKSGVRYA